VEKLAGDAVAAFGERALRPDYVRRTIEVAQKLSKLMAQEDIPVGIGVHSV